MYFEAARAASTEVISKLSPSGWKSCSWSWQLSARFKSPTKRRRQADWRIASWEARVYRGFFLSFDHNHPEWDWKFSDLPADKISPELNCHSAAHTPQNGEQKNGISVNGFIHRRLTPSDGFVTKISRASTWVRPARFHLHYAKLQNDVPTLQN